MHFLFALVLAIAFPFVMLIDTYKEWRIARTNRRYLHAYRARVRRKNKRRD